MNNRIHPEDFLKRYAVPGHAFFSNAIIEEKNEEKNEICTLLVKEELKNIKKIKKYKPQISSRLGLAKIDDVYLIVYMFRFVDIEGILYETLLNYHSEDGNKCLKLLTKQQNLYFMIHDEDNNSIRNIAMNNSLCQAFKKFENVIKSQSFKWSMNDFDKAKERLYQIYPTPVDLWNNLDNIDNETFYF